MLYCLFKHVILHQKKSETTYGLRSIRTIDGVGNRESLTFQGGGNWVLYNVERIKVYPRDKQGFIKGVGGGVSVL